MDISSLYNISSDVIRQAAENASVAGGERQADENNMFAAILNSAIDNLRQTNAYLSDAENEKIKLAMGQTDNTHDLSIAMQKASDALQYTVALRDRFLEAYREIMNIQI